MKILTILIALVLIGCNNPDQPDIRFDIATKVFFDDRLPDDFQGLNVPTDERSTVMHVMSSMLYPDTLYQLSTNDYDEALNWVNQQWSALPITPTFVSINENDLYFEFIGTTSNGTIDIPIYSRVFKGSALIRVGVNINQDQGYYGTIYLPIDSSTIKMVIEYLWHFTKYNNTGNAVIDSFGKDNKHTLVIASLSSFQIDHCVNVVVRNIDFYVDSAGAIFQTTSIIDQFKAKRDSNNNISLCN